MDVRIWLEAYMEKVGLTDLELAFRLGYTTNSPVSAVKRGERNIAAERVSQWADALKVEGEPRKEFIELAHLELAPDWLKLQYRDLKKTIENLEKEQANLRDLIRQMAEDRQRKPR
jgi:hypothetical protein